MSHDENIEKIEKLEKLNKLEDYLSPYLTLLKYYIEENDDSSGKTTKHHYELYANSRVTAAYFGNRWPAVISHGVSLSQSTLKFVI